ncbi:WD40-like Beta Propeller [Penicillium coprophilum]|uniref:WD40-like Beta Propeller n=1 Tax=Penicillium coprophilum TaxID=36646 RepID=UPI002396B2E5|nr:WD40-like Beta Propeller [Penicillium coprophilum]KAJ5170377.1 WD40-like Beta Propeller [Penicillium coprophilum]
MVANPDHKANLSLEALANLQVPNDLRISPDAAKVVYTLRDFSKKCENLTSSIWIAEIGKENSTRQFTSGLFHDEQPQWSPDGTSLAFKSDRGHLGKGSAIYVMPVNGGEPYPITPVDNEKPIVAFEWSPSGAFIAFTSADEKTEEQVCKEKAKNDATIWGKNLEYCRLKVVHIATRQIQTVVCGDRHVHDFSWSPDSTNISYIEHKEPGFNSAGFFGAKIRIASLLGAKLTTVTEFPGPISQVEWGHRGVYFIAGHKPTHCSTSLSLYRLCVEDGSYTEHESKESCCIRIQKNRSSLAYRVQHDLHDKLFAIDDGSHTPIHCGEYEMTSFDIFRTAKNTVIAITKGDGSSPEEVFSISESKDIVKLSDHNSHIAALKIAKQWSISATASDGYSLDGMIYVPSKYKAEDGPLATILIPHGGPYWRVTTSFSVCHCLEVPLLVSAGYAVLCPNYRGGSGRGEKHAAYARGMVGTVDYTDCIDILRNCIDKGLVDPSRVAIGGWSQGGFLSYLAVTRKDYQFRGAVCGAGVVDWDVLTMTSDAYWFEADMAGGAPWDVDENAKPGEELDDTHLKSSKEWIQNTNSRRGSALWHMRNVKTPVLILHGENDVRVPLTQAIAFYRACIHNNVPVDMVTYPREGHLITERKHVIDLWTRMRQFYDMNLR